MHTVACFFDSIDAAVLTGQWKHACELELSGELVAGIASSMPTRNECSKLQGEQLLRLTLLALRLCLRGSQLYVILVCLKDLSLGDQTNHFLR